MTNKDTEGPQKAPPTPEGTDPQQSAQEAPEEAQEGPGEEEGHGSNREAARYRRRLRETEQERDQLASQLETMRRAEVERLASSHQVKPAAFWAAGAQLPDLLTSEGAVDPEAVKQAADQAADQLGIQRGGIHAPTEGRLTPLPHPHQGDWTQAFAPKRGA